MQRFDDDLEMTVYKQDLINALKDHKLAHIEDYEKAVVVYFQDLTKKFHDLTADAISSKFRDDEYRYHIPKPINVVNNYNKYIGFLEMSKEEEILISLQQYNAYMNDEWEWAKRATVSNALYSSKY